MEKTVTRLVNGQTLKGDLLVFSPEGNEVVVKERGTERSHRVDISDVKAVFFVKTFEGDNEYREKKSYGLTKTKGQRIFVKFKDGESLVGFLEGEVPWKKGFFLSKQDGGLKGFFLLPVDEDTNNDRVFVVSSSVEDLTIIPGQGEQI